MKHFGFDSVHKKKQQKFFTFMILPDSGGGRIRTVKLPCWVLYGALAAVIGTTAAISTLSILNGYSQYHLERTLAEKEEILEEKTETEIEKKRIESSYNVQQDGFDKQLEHYKEQVTDLESRLIEMEQLAAQSYEKMNLPGSPVSYVPDESFMGGVYLPAAAETPAEQLDCLIRAVESEMDSAEAFLNQYAADAERFTAFQRALPSIWPVIGTVTSEQGGRSDPINGSAADHTGIDIKVPIGTPVQATADGTVTAAGVSSGYGNLVVIDHGYGYKTYYAHNSELLASVGDRVRRGDVIAHSGNSGRTTGPHVHYEVRYQGGIENPRNYLDQ